MTSKTEKKLAELLQKRDRLVATRQMVEKFVAAYDHAQHAIQVPVRLEMMNRTYKEFLSVQSEVEQLDKPETFKTHLALRCEFEEAFCVAKGFLLSKADHHTAHADVSLNSSFTHSHGPSSFHHRLPKIDLPKFDGDESKWISFRDNFISMIHINEDIPLVNKLQYLLQSLLDPAKKQFETVDIQADNYAPTWNELLKKYDNKRSLRKALFRRLYDLPAVEGESAEDLNTLVDDFHRHVKALEKLGEPIDKWDTPLVFILSDKLDFATLRAWEHDSRKKEQVTYEELIEFLNGHIRMLKSIPSDSQQRQAGNVKVAGPTQKKSQQVKFIANAATSEPRTYTPQCPSCSKQHHLYECPAFVKLAVIQRRELVNQRNLCWNCFRQNHQARACRSRFSCRICQAKHHTLLHDPGASEHTEGSPVTLNPTPTQQTSSATFGLANSSETSLPIVAKHDTVLLETVNLLITDNHGRELLVRALLDSASMSNFVSQNLADLLNIRPNSVDVSVAGLGESAKQIDKQITTTVKSLTSQFSTTLDFLIMKPPMVNLPRSAIDIAHWNMPDVPLADPHFNRPGAIDILIGGECYHELHTGQRKPIGDGLPLLIETRFGWTVTGKIPTDSQESSTLCCCSTTVRSILAAPHRLELEAVDPKPNHSAEQRSCKNSSTPTRTHNGRYAVLLPRSKDPQVTLGNSRESAVRRVYTHESSRKKDPSTKPTMKARLSHMRKNNNTKPHCSSGYPLVSSVMQADLRSRFGHPFAAAADEILEQQTEAQLANQPLKRTCQAIPSKPLKLYEQQPLHKRVEAERSCPAPVKFLPKKLYKHQIIYEGADGNRQKSGFAETTKIGRAVRNMLNAKWECEQMMHASPVSHHQEFQKQLRPVEHSETARCAYGMRTDDATRFSRSALSQ